MSPIAKKRADLIYDGDTRLQINDCQVTLEEHSIRLDGPDFETSIDVSTVFDLKLGPPPLSVAGSCSGKTLTIAVGRNGETDDVDRDIYFFSGIEDESIDQFGHVLYKTILNGTEVAVRHPSKIGGRKTDKSFTIGELTLLERGVGFSDIDVPFKVDVESIIDFTRSTEALLGEEKDIVTVEYIRNGRSIVFDVALTPDRKRHLLGRYLRLEYSKLQRELQQLDLNPVEIKGLSKIYTMDGKANLQTLLSGPKESTLKILKHLQHRGLLDTAEGDVTLTPKGWILMRTQFGDVLGTKRPGSNEIKQRLMA